MQRGSRAALLRGLSGRRMDPCDAPLRARGGSPPVSAARFACHELQRFALPDGAEIVYCPATRVARALPARVAELVASCMPFRSLEQHVAAFAAMRGLPPEERSALLRELSALSTDLLCAWPPGKSAGEPEPPARVTALAVPTGERPEGLRRLLTTTIEN